MEMNNCDDCTVDITGEIDTALELTKMYFNLHQPTYVNEETVYDVYKKMKDLIERDKEKNENED